MLEIEIDGKKLSVPNGTSVIEAAKSIGTYIPHFCYHKKLSIAASCRMCLVQVEKAPKPVPACATPVSDGMKVFTHSPMAVDAQRGVMEFLLINHPLDCPICDQGGECLLQDIAVGYGNSASRYGEDKRVVPNKDLGPLISTDMTRCIHCTRCVRFTEEIAGLQELGMAGRGEHSEIMPFIGMTVDSEISGNVIDLCPVGALTSKPFRYSARTWELSRRRSVSPHDGLGSNQVVQVMADRVMRVLPLENEAINECWLSDRDRFSYTALDSPERLQKPMIKQGGKWIDVDWPRALDYVAHGLKEITLGGGRVAALSTEQATLEEMYLLQQLARGLGGVGAEFRSRYGDPRLAQVQEGALWLGQTVSELTQAHSILLLGSTVRKEQPLLAHRLRQAVRQGSKLMVCNPMADPLNCPITQQLIVSPSQMVATLAAITQAAAQLAGSHLPVEITAVAAARAQDPIVRAIAQQLFEASQQETCRSAILLGNLAAWHPQASELAWLAQQLAEITHAHVGWMSAGANTVGAQVLGLGGASPAASTDIRVLQPEVENWAWPPEHAQTQQRQAQQAGQRGAALGKTTDMAEDPQAWLLLNTEIEYDSYDPRALWAKLKRGKMVVALSAFHHGASEYADVFLPITPYTETAGSFINMEGRLQSFHGVVKPLGEARPGWKVLRVLGSLLGLPNFEFENVEAVRKAALPQGESGIRSRLNNRVRPVTLSQGAASGLERLGEVPIYQADALTRRARPLQATGDAAAPRLGLAAATAQRLDLRAGQRVRVRQGDQALELEVAIDPGLAEDVVRVAAAHPATAGLGPMFGAVQVERL